MASLKVLSDSLKGSGWTEALVQAGVASSGKANSFLKASHVTRTRRAHQITASSLYLLQQNAYKEYIQILGTDSEVMSFEDWCDARSHSSPQFQFWSLILKLEVVVMVYVRAIRGSQLSASRRSLVQDHPLVLLLKPYALFEMGANPFARHDVAKATPS